ncbi:putative ADP-ribose 1''-phosphate phosphatase [Aspergillus taichungensis]|uniref:ADP-ribose 1''-phosphate phosphatase n=1 Tax=Aspergillus taichungensis TaxID=482145 RepID=A0A2J5I9J5_9EURO|nr:putative ADP-ribose 1''-phosphate phosphatase [Aspergillus taichungensis]
MITEVQGDLFDAPDGAALIHACNCQGSWGKGIAEAFKKKYPAAFKIYRAHCQEYLENKQFLTTEAENPDETQQQKTTRTIQLPIGTALIIPPQKDDYNGEHGKKRHWIICLFTSRGFGRSVSPPAVILQNTALAVADMKGQLERLRSQPENDVPLGELRSCRFNAGLFGVEWKLSREVLEEAGLEVTVVRPEGEPLGL